MAGASPVLARYREDLLSSYRVLVEAKKGIAAAVRAVLEAESSMHGAAIKSYQATLASLPNTPSAQVQG
jgi:hypothetical protein